MKTKKFRADQRGQSLVELAITLGIILMLLAGAINFGLALFSYVAIRDAAQEGALYASLEPCGVRNTTAKTCVSNDATIRGRVRSASTHPVNLSNTTLIPDSDIMIQFNGSGWYGGRCEGTSGGAVNSVTVTVRYNQPIVMPFAGIFFGGQSIPLTASVTDTILTPACDQ